ncbi:salicylate synthase [Saccharopolyspora pogona]|uniref:salicylate synthase n=1 Tax=Saccharopolyspora pogona TaxID=333966 RepID=UPI00168767F2|nr:salicylate synthase [Saccharopolyspora pogona]
MNRHYRTAVVQTHADAIAVSTGLASSGIFDTYVVYEDPFGWWIAGGVAAEFVLGPNTVRVTQHGQTTESPWRGDPLAVVQAFLATVDIADWRAYGWSAFELAYAIAGIATDEHVLLHLVIPETEIQLTPEHALVRSLDRTMLARVEDALTVPPVPAPSSPHGSVDVRLDTTADSYQASVSAIVRDIQAGRLQKAVLSRVVPVEEKIDFPASYLRGRRANTPARSFLLRMGGMQAFGFSPETVVEVDPHQRVVSQPLAGTRALTGDPEGDQALRDDLLADPKELHEHAISVKIAVDELTTACRPETVIVEEFMAVKERGSVQHLASRVAGQLPEDGNPWEAFAAVFPAVTASGVPKHAAYEAIRTHEPSRGLYAGTVMTVGADGSIDAALVLRSAFSFEGRTWLRAGAGVVAQSRPERELQETIEKLGSVRPHLVAQAKRPEPEIGIPSQVLVGVPSATMVGSTGDVA